MVINANVCAGVIYMMPANTFWNTLPPRAFLHVIRSFRPYLNLIYFRALYRASEVFFFARGKHDVARAKWRVAR